MNCPFCSGSTRVVDSRPAGEGVRRRRECERCGKRYTTLERDIWPEIRVLKARARPVEIFDRAKVLRSLEKVCRNRPVSPETQRELARGVEMTILGRGVGAIHSGEIAEMLVERLREEDRLAAERFSINYRDEYGRLTFERADPDELADPFTQIDLFGEDES